MRGLHAARLGAAAGRRPRISVTHVDTAGLDALADLAQRLDRAGVEPRPAAVKDYPVETFDSSGTTQRIGREHFYPTVGAAVAVQA